MLMLCQHLKNLGLQEVKHLQCSTGSTSQATLSSVGMCLSCYVYAHHQYSTQQGFQDFFCCIVDLSSKWCRISLPFSILHAKCKLSN